MQSRIISCTPSARIFLARPEGICGRLRPTRVRQQICVGDWSRSRSSDSATFEPLKKDVPKVTRTPCSTTVRTGWNVYTSRRDRDDYGWPRAQRFDEAWTSVRRRSRRREVKSPTPKKDVNNAALRCLDKREITASPTVEVAALSSGHAACERVAYAWRVFAVHRRSQYSVRFESAATAWSVSDRVDESVGTSRRWRWRLTAQAARTASDFDSIESQGQAPGLLVSRGVCE